jgi:hypothetical protein
MARLPTSLSIALWIVGSCWALGILAVRFDMSGEVVWAAMLFGIVVGIYEWLSRRQRGL